MNVLITIGGAGSRLKCLSPLDKYKLYYKGKKIIDWLLELFPKAMLLGNEKTASRKETLMQAKGLTNCLIVDCDIVATDKDRIK